MHDLRQQVIAGVLWRGLEVAGSQGLQLVTQVILARLLVPADFGLVALLSVFLALAGTFADSGFGTALVQKQHVSDIELSSVFYFNLACAAGLCLLLAAVAPIIAAFYDQMALVGLLRGLSFVVVLDAVGRIQSTILLREMNFKRSARINLAATLGSGAVGMAMAWSGFGCWSLVGSALVASALSTALLWLSSDWRPHRHFSWQALRGLFGYSSKLLASGILDTLFNNIYPLIIGRLFPPAMLGYYNRGQTIPKTFASSLNSVVSGVLFPALAACQQDAPRLKRVIRQLIQLTTFVVFPALLGLAAVAEPLVRLVLTEKWIPCVPYLQVCCLGVAFWPVHVANLQVPKATGRSDIFLVLELVKKLLFLLVLFATVRFGLLAMVAGQAVLSAVGTLLNAWPNRHLIGYSFREQFGDIAPALGLALAMSGLVWAFGTLLPGQFLKIACQVLLGVVLYLAVSHLVRMPGYELLQRELVGRLVPGHGR